MHLEFNRNTHTSKLLTEDSTSILHDWTVVLTTKHHYEFASLQSSFGQGPIPGLSGAC